jgi:TIR domain
MPTIFISYASADGGVAALLQKWLRETLEDDVKIFLAGDPGSVPLGYEWFARISGALREADFLIVVVSAAAARSTWVTFEAGFVAGRDKPVIPVLVPPFRLEQLRAPLAARQAIELESGQSLERILKTLELPNREGATTNLESAFTDLEKAWKERRKVTLVDATFLTSRKDMYDDINNLLKRSDGPIHVRATSTLRDHDADDDPLFEQYLEVLANRCGEAPDLSQCTLVMSYPVDEAGKPIEQWARALALRQMTFRKAGAERCLKIRRSPEFGTLDVITINYEYAVIGMPITANDPHLRGAIRVMHPALVATFTRWFDECVVGGAEEVR